MDEDTAGQGSDAIARRLQHARRTAGMTQRELADHLGLTPRSIQGYEAGAVVPYRHLRTIARLLGRDMTWLLDGRGPRRTGGASLMDELDRRDRRLREELREI